ncbi:MAG: acetoacetate decarboxylase family protein [Halobacteriota archaeon]
MTRTSDGGKRPATLSSGREISLPLRCECDLAGAVVTARWSALRRIVPREVRPIRVSPTRGLVVLAGIDYHEAGDLAPYSEFAVVVPVGGRAFGIPLPGGGFGGYVVDLPVTTEDSRIVGSELWGYPKSVADIAVESDATHLRTRLQGEVAPDLALDVRRGRTRWRALSLDSYTVLHGELLRSRVDLEGELGFGPGRGVRLALGDGPLPTRLRSLDLGRVVGRFFGTDVEATIHEGEPD